ncbi:MAG: phosphotransferase [Wenzhouxiangellaceae bacterium]|nr:phosphotransferase [Wenzhouxiangellaceae bacterium]
MNCTPPYAPDARARRARDWACARLGWSHARFEPASADASFRRYFRISPAGSGAADASRIVMDAPPDREPVDAFVDIAGRLAAAGLHVPAIEAEDRDNGFLLLSDLGDRPWHRVLDERNLERTDARFGQAVDALVGMQRHADPTGLPEYDAALLLAELALFPDWFLARHWRVEPTEAELDDWEMVCMTLIRWALDQPKVFCHRDFMPRNLMDCEPNPGILDFQDAVLGPIAYDPVCLFRDAFLSWPEERVDGWLEQYRLKAAAAGLPVPPAPDLWRRTCDLMGAQRHLKVIGIFARIRYRDGKPGYLDDVPRFFSYLAGAISRNPELAVLGRLLDAWRARAEAP